MERESFVDEDVAKYLNEHFVSVKVDREEHPDVDHQYMLFLQATTGGGGWPLSVFLTPDRKPFLGGTYFPPNDSPQTPSFMRVLHLVSDLWTKEHDRIMQAAEQGLDTLKIISTPSEQKRELEDTAEGLERNLHGTYDPQNGGFGPAPKFPSPPTLLFLMLQSGETGCAMALKTLLKMSMGGIHDHVGGGFHRYSVDPKWHVPHFEKMLYDQGQLLDLYARAGRLISKDDTWPREAAMDIVDYVKRRLMSATTGAFYSAEDADSLPTPEAREKKEGAFAVWTIEEVNANLKEDAALFCSAFDVKPEGNVPSQLDIHSELQGKNVLRRVKTDEELASDYSINQEQVRDSLLRSRENLQSVARPRPHLDDKMVTAWNGFMISGLVKSFESFGVEEHLSMALKAAEFFASQDDQLMRYYKDDGPFDAPANASDYASMIKAFIDLHQVTLDATWKQAAIKLQEAMNERFWDQDNGGYVNSSSPMLLLPMKEDHDGVEPCSNSLALGNLKRLRLLDERFLEYCRKQEEFIQSRGHVPYGLTVGLCDPVMLQLVAVKVEDAKEWLDVVLQSRESEYQVVIDFVPGSELSAHICKDSTCGPPLKTIEEVKEAMP